MSGEPIMPQGNGEQLELNDIIDTDVPVHYWGREEFREFVDALDTLDESSFAFTQENYRALLAIVIAFNSNAGVGRINSDDLERFGEVGAKITKAILKSANIDTALLPQNEFKRMGFVVDNFAKPTKLSIGLNFRQEGTSMTIDEYTFNPDGTVSKKEDAWNRRRIKK